jgi:hypothetical protein
MLAQRDSNLFALRLAGHWKQSTSASVSKRLPPDLKESVWISITEGFARKAEEFLHAAENLRD